MIPMFKVRMSEKAPEMVAEVLRSGMIGEGKKCEEFRQKLFERYKSNNWVLLNSGTSAITLALRLAEVHGGEVITTPFTMIATNVAIKAAGAEIVFADIEKDTVLISYESIKEKITPRTKAILVTAVGGTPPDLENICKLGLPVIIDAAHAIDTYYKGLHISNWGDYVCFSFQAIKQLTTGDGGALVVKDDGKYDRAEKLKWFGMSRQAPEGLTRLEHQMTSDVEEWGYKFHMNDISATIGLANLELLDNTNKKQRNNALEYLWKLPSSMLPNYPENDDSCFWAFYLFVDKRKEFIEYMKSQGIETTPMWRRNDEYTTFRKAELPNVTALQDKIIFIPVGWWLKDTERRHIVESIIRFNSSQA